MSEPTAKVFFLNIITGNPIDFDFLPFIEIMIIIYIFNTYNIYLTIFYKT